jgi:hypothetical protein
LACLLNCFYSAWAATNDSNFPELNPPRGELPPGFWEEQGALIILASVTAALLFGVVIWLLLRPKTARPLPPGTIARTNLEALLPQPESKAVLSRVSHILREYVTSVLGLPPGERNTAELVEELSRDGSMPGELSRQIVSLLRDCDQRKFDPASSGPPLRAAEKALGWVAAVETDRQARAEAGQAQAPEGQKRQE